MYEQFYGFGERPFSLLPDADFLFHSTGHQAALDTLESALFNRHGWCVLSGEIGAGKTTLIRALLNRLDAGICVGLVSNTHPSFGELLQWVAGAYGLPVGGSDKLTLHKTFIDFIIDQYARNRRTLLIVDEAQHLTLAALEELRMLCEINSDKDFVLQVVLVGQPQLRDKLRDPGLRQLAQRIALDYHLQALTETQTVAYIAHRLRHAGGTADLFTPGACRTVAAYTQGVPRLINRLCDLSLVYGYAEQRTRIDADLVARVAADRQLSLGASLVTPAGAQPEVPASADRAEHLQAIGAPTQTGEPIPDTRGAQREADTGAGSGPDSETISALRQITHHQLLFASDHPAPRRRRERLRRRPAALAVVVVVALGAAGWMGYDRWLQPVGGSAGQLTAATLAAGRALLGSGHSTTRPSPAPSAPAETSADAAQGDARAASPAAAAPLPPRL